MENVKYFSTTTVLNAVKNGTNLWEIPSEHDEDGEALMFIVKNGVHKIVCATDGGGAGDAHWWTLELGDEIDWKLGQMLAAKLIEQFDAYQESNS